MHQILDSKKLDLVGEKLIRQDVDRWIFVFVAALLFVTVLAGFIPSSIEKISAIQSGQRAAFPSVLHIHAILMGSWISLLLAQACLVAGSHSSIHQRLGMLSMVLMPAIIVCAFILVPINFGIAWGLDLEVVPSEVIARRKLIVSNIALSQIRVGILFPAIVALALYFRNKDTAIHKRLMILATVVPMTAATDRINWLPSTTPSSPTSLHLYILVLVLPLLAYDIIRFKRIPLVYIYWAVGWLSSSVIVNLLWSSPWWLSTVPKIMGVESW